MWFHAGLLSRAGQPGRVELCGDLDGILRHMTQSGGRACAVTRALSADSSGDSWIPRFVVRDYSGNPPSTRSGPATGYEFSSITLTRGGARTCRGWWEAKWRPGTFWECSTRP